VVIIRLLSGFILTAGYGGNLRALLTKKKLDNPITNFASAVQSGKMWTFAYESIGFLADIKETGPLVDRFLEDANFLSFNSTIGDAVSKDATFSI